MADIVGLIVQGDDVANHLSVSYNEEANGDLTIYNVVYAGGGNDEIDGRPGGISTPFDRYGAQLFGEDGNDRIFDTSGSDTINGGNGNDYLVSIEGSDVIDGGDGIDTVRLDGRLASNAVTISNVERLEVSLGVKVAGFDLNQFDFLTYQGISGNLRFVQAAALETPQLLGKNWIIAGSRDNDILDVSRSAGHMKISAEAGDDIVISGSSADLLNGGSGNDTLTGGAGEDNIFGGQGDDVIFGGAGKDYIMDNSGNDTIHGGEDNDIILVNRGTSVVFGDEGNDRIRMENATCRVYGGEGDDTFLYLRSHGNPVVELHGGHGQDWLDAGFDISAVHARGIETLRLTSQNVTISPNTLDSFDAIVCNRFAKPEVISLSEAGGLIWRTDIERVKNMEMIGSSGADHLDLTASLMHWTVRGGTGEDVIIGGSQESELYGGADNDILTGIGTWSDLEGQQGNDTLIGLSQRGFMTGGAGDDVFVFGTGTNYAFGDSGNDRFLFDDDSGSVTIYDFLRHGTERDRIDFSEVSTIKDFDDLMEHHVQIESHGLLITFGSSKIELMKISSKEIDASDFIF